MGVFQEGQNILGIYEVERFLGEGAFAEVYRVKHRFLGRQAMKIFKITGITLDEVVEMLGEAFLLSKLRHPNIVSIFDANTTETAKGVCGFFTMEYVAGGTLDKYWKSFRNRIVPVESAVDITRQICLGLSVAHSEDPPIVHRDIKPQNILVGYDKEGLHVRISDFGLAKKANPLTLMVSARGTRCFKAPETFDNFQSDSCGGDVWAIGSVLYLLITDRLPYLNVGETDVFDSECFLRPLTLPSKINWHVDRFLDNILLRALAPKPAERYSNAMEMLVDLNKWKPGLDGKTAQDKSDIASSTEKSVLGALSSMDDKEVSGDMANRALLLARNIRTLPEAADLMEEAFNKLPKLREKYEHRVKLWRKGIMQ